MSVNQTLNDIQWQELIRSVAEYYNDLTIKRGFQYYKQGRVAELSIGGDGEIEAVVKGGEAYRVHLNPQSVQDSRCSCPVGERCKHSIAALLEYVSRQGRSVHAIVNAHTTVRLQHHLPEAEEDLGPMQRGSAADALREKAAHLAEMSLSEWHAFFKLCITPLEFTSQNSHYARNAIHAINAVKPGLTPALEQLYQLHARLYMLIKLIKPIVPGGRSPAFLGYHVQVAADELRGGMLQLLGEGIDLAAEPDQWPRVTKTLNYLRRQMLTETGQQGYLFDVYDRFWLKWIHPNVTDTRMHEEEMGKLQSAEEELGDTLSRLPWMLAQARIAFLMGEDRQAWSWLQAADKASIIPHGFLTSFLDELSASEDWARLQEWLVRLAPLFSNHRKEPLHEYAAYWNTFVRHVPEAEEMMWHTLAGMLPYSKEVYEDNLLAHEKWRLWMDVQLSSGKDPLEFRVSVLAPIEKQAPELLLPFYHQGVERHVLLKNRSGYKAAVKLLKRLAKLYKKLKREERWEEFIIVFSSRHSRLRALQEELRKGKLIP